MNKLNIIQKTKSIFSKPHVRFLYKAQYTAAIPPILTGMVPIAVSKPNFTPARLPSENKAQYHARIKTQKLYIRAMQNGGASYVYN